MLYIYASWNMLPIKSGTLEKLEAEYIQREWYI